MRRDSGEIANERFLKALTVEVEEITEEAVQAGKIEEKKDLINIENEMEEHPVFLQTRMVGLSEVRRNLEEWDALDEGGVWIPGGGIGGSGANQPKADG